MKEVGCITPDFLLLPGVSEATVWRAIKGARRP
jgi:hypothetical protein